MKQYTVVPNYIYVMGELWVPRIEAAGTYSPRNDEVTDMLLPDGNINREAVWSWLDTHARDFRVIHDFKADLATHPVSDWENPENEFKFMDMVYGEEEAVFPVRHRRIRRRPVE